VVEAGGPKGGLGSLTHEHAGREAGEDPA